MSSTIIVGCRLPFGIRIRLHEKEVTLNGANKSIVIGGDCGYTEIEKEFWDTWIIRHSTNQIITSGAVFASEKPKDVKVIAKEHRGRKTGFEPLPQDETDAAA